MKDQIIKKLAPNLPIYLQTLILSRNRYCKFVMRWEEESEQIRRDVVGRYLYRKGVDPIPIYVSVHKDIAQAFEAFENHAQRVEVEADGDPV